MPKKSHMVWIAAASGLSLAVALGILWLTGTPGTNSLDPARVGGTMSTPREGWPVEFKTVDWSSSGPYRNHVEALIRSEDDWVRLNDRERPIGAPSLPPVDWERSSLVLVSLEDNVSGAREMEIVGVSLDGGRILVDVQVREVQGATPGSPFHLIEVPASEADEVVVREVPIENDDSEQPGPKATTWGRLKSKFSS